ncbi:MAG: DUF3604 domain-containing protein [Alphaproteobacteria bacterium]|nr:DUF3604 domain-containing protein [Alphaproteobacteria bacterium]
MTGIPLHDAHLGAVETPLCPTAAPADLGRVVLTATSLSPNGRFEAWSFARLRFAFTAGVLGMDDGAHLRLAYRWTHDGGGLQTDQPAAMNYVSAEASNGAELVLSYGPEAHTRPFDRALTVTVRRGFLAPGETIIVTIGDTSRGSPGFRLQSFAESGFHFRVLVDAMATQHFTLLPERPGVAILPAAPAVLRLIAPTRRRVGEPWFVALRAEDRFGNPAEFPDRPIRLGATTSLDGLADGAPAETAGALLRWGPLRARAIGGLRLFAEDVRDGAGIAAAPVEIVAADAPISAWADLHGQSGETVGINSADDYFRFAREVALLDAAAHQGNDFQINDRFWDHLNRVTARHDAPGRFVAIPGYEWSGNTAVGGDRNVLYRHEGQPIHRSCRALVAPGEARDADAPTAPALFAKLASADAVCFAHVGGRYADLARGHDPRLERSVEVHSCWGTFEWLIEDAHRLGLRVGIVANSDDHKGRPGAAHPGASSFGALGGLTCLLVDRIDRDSVFAALRARRHFATTGVRLDLAIEAALGADAVRLDDEGREAPTRTARMGDIVRTTATDVAITVRLAAPGPIDRVEIRRGAEQVGVLRPFAPSALGARLRLQWEGAAYRGRGRQVVWNGAARLEGVGLRAVRPFNLWSPHHDVERSGVDGVAWRSVTTGNQAGCDLILESWEPDAAVVFETAHVSGRCRLGDIGDGDVVFDAGGLGRRLRLFRLPDDNPRAELAATLRVPCWPGRDTPIYAVATLEDGHRAWTSPIYVVR